MQVGQVDKTSWTQSNGALGVSRQAEGGAEILDSELEMSCCDSEVAVEECKVA